MFPCTLDKSEEFLPRNVCIFHLHRRPILPEPFLQFQIALSRASTRHRTIETLLTKLLDPACILTAYQPADMFLLFKQILWKPDPRFSLTRDAILPPDKISKKPHQLTGLLNLLIPNQGISPPCVTCYLGIRIYCVDWLVAYT
jgi:hypothetical protein